MWDNLWGRTNLPTLEPTQSIVGSIFIHFRKGGIIEASIDEKTRILAEQEGGETCVNEVGSLLADAMNSKETHILGVEEKFQKTLMVTDDKSSGVVGVGRATDHVRNALGAQRLLGFPRAGALGNGVDAKRQNTGDAGLVFEVKSVAHRDAALLHGSRGQRRKANNITRRVDVGDIGLVVLVHFQQTAFIF